MLIKQNHPYLNKLHKKVIRRIKNLLLNKIINTLSFLIQFNSYGVVFTIYIKKLWNILNVISASFLLTSFNDIVLCIFVVILQTILEDSYFPLLCYIWWIYVLYYFISRVVIYGLKKWPTQLNITKWINTRIRIFGQWIMNIIGVLF